MDLSLFLVNGPHNFQSLGNNEVAELHGRNSKVFFGPILTKIGTTQLGKGDSTLFKCRVTPFSKGRS